MIILFLPTERHTETEEQNVQDKVSNQSSRKGRLKCQSKGWHCKQLCNLLNKGMGWTSQFSKEILQGWNHCPKNLSRTQYSCERMNCRQQKQNRSGFSPKVLFVILLVCTNNILFLFIQIMKKIFHNKSDWYEHVHFLRNRESSG